MKKQHSQTRFWVLYHFGLLVFSALVSFLMKFQQTGNLFHPTVLVPLSSIFLMSAGIGYLAIFMVNKAKNYNQAELTKRIIPALLIFYIGSFVIANLSISIGVFFWFLHLGRDLSEFLPQLFNHELNFASGRFFIWLMFFTIAFFYVLWHKSVKNELRIKVENQKFRYQNLKSQVNPHFLFNSLNTLSEIVYEDAKKADKFIQKLSGIYRYILENEEIDLVPLNKEIEFVKQYFDIQKVRDNDKILLEIDFQDADEFKVVPVSLQILVENALKHNSRSEKLPLKIRIERNIDKIVVSNNIQRKNILESKPKTGLLNLKERVKLILDKDLIYEEDNNQFIVKLPIIKS
jgi:hypothetical protein